MKPTASHSLIQAEAEALAAATETLATKGAIPAAIPADTIAEWLTHVLKVDPSRRTAAGERGLRYLSKARPGDDLGAVFLERLDWHFGRGSAGLGRVFMSQLKAAPELWDQEDLDTLALVMAILAGKAGRSHSDRWAAALGL
jgi:hypothetical protein